MSINISNLFIDYRKCPKDKKLSGFFPELSVWPEFTKCKDDNIIKIAILTGDIESEFVTGISDRKQMLRAVFKHLGIDPEKRKVLFEDIEKYRHEEYMRAWYRYMYISNEMEFSLWLMLKSDYSLLLEESNKPAKKNLSPMELSSHLKNKKDMRIQLATIINEIKEIEAKLFPDSRAARQMVNVDRRIKVYAEKFAEEGVYL